MQTRMPYLAPHIAVLDAIERLATLLESSGELEFSYDPALHDAGRRWLAMVAEETRHPGSTTLGWDGLFNVGELLLWDERSGGLSPFLTRLSRHPGLPTRLVSWGGRHSRIKPLRPMKGGGGGLTLSLRRGRAATVDRTWPHRTAQALRRMADRVRADTAHVDDTPSPDTLRPYLAVLGDVERFVAANPGDRAAFRPRASRMEAAFRALLEHTGLPENAITPVTSMAGHLDKLFGDVVSCDAVAVLLPPELPANATPASFSAPANGRVEARPEERALDPADDDAGVGDDTRSATITAGTVPLLVPVAREDSRFTHFPHLNAEIRQTLVGVNEAFHGETGTNLRPRRGEPVPAGDKLTENPYIGLHLEFDFQWISAEGSSERVIGTLNGPFRNTHPAAAEALERARATALEGVANVLRPGDGLRVVPVDPELRLWTDRLADPTAFLALIRSSFEILLGDAVKGVGVLINTNGPRAGLGDRDRARLIALQRRHRRRGPGDAKNDAANDAETDAATGGDTLNFGQVLQHSDIHAWGRHMVALGLARRGALLFSPDDVKIVDDAAAAAIAVLPKVGAAVIALAELGRTSSFSEAGNAVIEAVLAKIGGKSIDGLIKEIADIPAVRTLLIEAKEVIEKITADGGKAAIDSAEWVLGEVRDQVVENLVGKGVEAILPSAEPDSYILGQ